MTDELDLQEFGESIDTHTAVIDGKGTFEIFAITNDGWDKIIEETKDMGEEEEVGYIADIVEEYTVQDVNTGTWGMMKTMRVWVAMQEAWKEDEDIKQAMKQVETPGNRQLSRQRPNKR